MPGSPERSSIFWGRPRSRSCPSSTLRFDWRATWLVRAGRAQSFRFRKLGHAASPCTRNSWADPWRGTAFGLGPAFGSAHGSSGLHFVFLEIKECKKLMLIPWTQSFNLLNSFFFYQLPFWFCYKSHFCNFVSPCSFSFEFMTVLGFNNFRAKTEIL